VLVRLFLPVEHDELLYELRCFLDTVDEWREQHNFISAHPFVMLVDDRVDHSILIHVENTLNSALQYSPTDMLIDLFPVDDGYEGNDSFAQGLLELRGTTCPRYLMRQLQMRFVDCCRAASTNPAQHLITA